jgi:hypothetical protein
MLFSRTIRSVLLVVSLSGTVPGLFASDFDLMPAQPPFFSASSLDFRYYLFTGTENNRVVNHGNFGLEFPVAGYEPWNLTAGLAAAAHLVMYPDHFKWPVDNFYATLAAYIDVAPSSPVSFRFYPVYHVSGHLADGSTNDTALEKPEAISAEMTKLETDLKPLRGLSLSLGYGRYYHVCVVQKNLTDHADAGILLQPRQSGVVRPYFLMTGELVHMLQWYPGFDMELGARFASIRNRAIGVSLRYFNIMDPGYYFMSREKSLGVQFDFLL